MERGGYGTISLRLFYARSALRLYPALSALVAFGATVAGALDVARNEVPFPWAAVVAVTYTTNLTAAFGHYRIGPLDHTWSLAQEEQFYLVWPAILALLLYGRVRHSRIAAGLAVVTTLSFLELWLLYHPRPHGETPIRLLPARRARGGVLLSGVLLALAIANPDTRSAIARRGRAMTWPGTMVDHTFPSVASHELKLLQVIATFVAAAASHYSRRAQKDFGEPGDRGLRAAPTALHHAYRWRLCNQKDTGLCPRTAGIKCSISAALRRASACRAISGSYSTLNARNA